ncbi:MAG: hypothetical protein AAFU85_06755 [Planctomycetota bacterium]
MPAQFDSFGLRFLYPDNWTVAQRDEEDGNTGMTLDLPEGGFFSVETAVTSEPAELIEELAVAIASEYEDPERESISLELLPDAPATDLRFYYLDLLIICRIVVFRQEEDRDSLVIQMQAESREFDKNEPVFDAILKQIVDNVG